MEYNPHFSQDFYDAPVASPIEIPLGNAGLNYGNSCFPWARGSRPAAAIIAQLRKPSSTGRQANIEPITSKYPDVNNL